MVCNSFNEKRFKAIFCITKVTFLYICGEIKDLHRKEAICEKLVPPKARLAVTLYKLAEGDYLHTVGELVSLGASAICDIIQKYVRVPSIDFGNRFFIKIFQQLWRK